MKLIIFAGGIGTRLWPLSRENSPKQFDKLFDGKSTLQLAMARLEKHFSYDDIFIQTLDNFAPLIREQIPELPTGNIIIEPSRRNLGPAVCLAVLEMKKRGYDGPMAILWADHLMQNPDEFVSALKTGEKLIEQEANRFVFLSEKPRFANNNLGWIHVGDKIGNINEYDYFSFRGWKYKPSSDECEQMFNNGEYYWNPGYFISSVKFLEMQYADLAPDIYDCVKSGRYDEALATHFDRAIIEKVDLDNAVIIKTDMGWSDPGTLYALKEALANDGEEVVERGNVSTLNCTDSLVYNLEDKKLVCAVGLGGAVIINTEDALIVVSKNEVVNITKLVEKLRQESKNEYL